MEDEKEIRSNYEVQDIMHQFYSLDQLEILGFSNRIYRSLQNFR